MSLSSHLRLWCTFGALLLGVLWLYWRWRRVAYEGPELEKGEDEGLTS